MLRRDLAWDSQRAKAPHAYDRQLQTYEGQTESAMIYPSFADQTAVLSIPLKLDLDPESTTIKDVQEQAETRQI